MFRMDTKDASIFVNIWEGTFDGQESDKGLYNPDRIKAMALGQAYWSCGPEWLSSYKV